MNPNDFDLENLNKIDNEEKEIEKNHRLLITVVVLVLLIVLMFIYIACDLVNDKRKNKENENNNTESEEVIKTKNYKDFEEKITISESEVYTAKYTFTKQENYKDEVPPSDLYSITTNAKATNQLYIINNGELYYRVGVNLKLDNPSNNDKELKKYEGLKDIKRIKSINFNNEYYQLLITNKGGVYLFRKYPDKAEEFELIKRDDLSKYNVNDVLEYTWTAPAGSQYKVVLDDGTILTKTITK